MDILLVEDREEDAILLRLLLGRSEAGRALRIRWVQTLAQAEAALAVRWPEVALVDLTLPDSAGDLDALERLLGRVPSLPVVVLSGMDDPALVAAALARGARGFVSKNRLDAAALVRGVQEAVSGRHRLLAELPPPCEDLAEAMEQSPQGIVVLREGRVWYANPRAAAVLGRPLAGLLGAPSPLGGAALPVQVAVLREGERLRPLEVVGLLAGGAAHELNNQLMVIQGFTELALHALEPAGRAGAHLQRVAEAARRAAGITAQMVSLVRPPDPPGGEGEEGAG